MHELTDNLLIAYHGGCFRIAPSNALDMRKVHAPHHRVDPPVKCIQHFCINQATSDLPYRHVFFHVSHVACTTLDPC